MNIFTSLFLANLLTTGAYAQVTSTPIILEESKQVLGKGASVDVSAAALLELYREARTSNFGVQLARHRKKTIILNQEYIVFSSTSNVPTQVKRKVILNQSVHYGEAKDTECAVKILQLPRIADSPRAVN